MHERDRWEALLMVPAVHVNQPQILTGFGLHRNASAQRWVSSKVLNYN